MNQELRMAAIVMVSQVRCNKTDVIERLRSGLKYGEQDDDLEGWYDTLLDMLDVIADLPTA